MRVYITGIQGMLGSAIAYIHHNTYRDTVAGCDISTADSLFSHIDITDKNELARDIERFRPDRIYHCAAMLGVQNTEEHPMQCTYFNEDGTRNVAEIARVIGAELVFLSSSEVYGNGVPGEAFHEGSPLLGDNVYAQSKLAGEMEVLRDGTPKSVVCRMFNCYGPNQVKQFFIPKALHRALNDMPIPIYGDPKNVRSYLFSYDAAQFIIDVANNAETGTICNVASDEQHTLQSVADTILQITGSQSVIDYQREVYEDRQVSRDVPNRTADTGLLKQYSLHVPSPLNAGIRFVQGQFDTLKDDWNYTRY